MADTHEREREKLFSAWNIVRFLKNITIYNSQHFKYGLTLKLRNKIYSYKFKKKIKMRIITITKSVLTILGDCSNNREYCTLLAQVQCKFHKIASVFH
jgi:hypothetical protein